MRGATDLNEIFCNYNSLVLSFKAQVNDGLIDGLIDRIRRLNPIINKHFLCVLVHVELM